MSALIPPNVAETAAPLLLGTVWNWTLYGVLLVQTYVYSYNFPNDRTFLKLLVYPVFLLETLQTALSGADLYHWFVSGFGNMDRLNSPHASAFDVPIIASVVSLTVQFFFVFRIWVLSNKSSRPLCVIICVVSILDAIAAIGGGIYAHIRGTFITGRDLKITALTWLCGNTLSDLLITGAMLYYLGRRRHRGDGYFSDHALSKIVRLTVETNILTSKWTPSSGTLLGFILPSATVGIVSLLMVAAYSDKNWYTCPTAILGKLYSNTLLVSLNNRISIRDAPVRGAVTVPVTPRSRFPMELEKPSAALGAWPSDDGSRRDNSSIRVFDIA
jgi:hypothetical protein